MKTVNTVLPIYDKLDKQCFHKSKYAAGDKGLVAPVVTPRHKLPSILWIDDGDGCATVSAVYLVDAQGVETDITTYFVTLPTFYAATDDDYFQYKGDTLKYLLPCGMYYLKITMNNGYNYYSEWMLVEEVYENLISSWMLDSCSYDTFIYNGTALTSAINIAGGAFGYVVDTFAVRKGEEIKLIFYLASTGVELPTFTIVEFGLGGISNSVQAIAGLNEITFTVTQDSTIARLEVKNTAASNFSITEAFLFREYSEKYLTFKFTHECNLGDILYEDHLEQILFLESEAMEPTFPYVEKGQENGFGVFVPTWQRQDKVYIIRTLLVAQFIVDVLHRLKLHDDITLIDLVGDEWTVITIDTEHEWQFDDKYYAMATITVNLGEGIVVTACCADNNTCK